MKYDCQHCGSGFEMSYDLLKHLALQCTHTHLESNALSSSVNPKDKVGVKKPQLDKVPESSIIYQALAMQNGAEKYGAYNWRETKVSASIYIAACKRHLASWFDSREDNAEDSGVPHLGHALACIGILVDALETGNLIDDRPKAGPSSALIKKWSK